MKKIFLLVVMLVGLTSTVAAKDYVAKTSTRKVYTDTITGDTYTSKGIKYDVFKSKSDARYIWKDGKKSYLPKNIQIEMGRKYNK